MAATNCFGALEWLPVFSCSMQKKLCGLFSVWMNRFFYFWSFSNQRFTGNIHH